MCKKLYIVIVMLIVSLFTTAALIGCKKRGDKTDAPPSVDPVVPPSELQQVELKYATDARQGYYVETLGTVARRLPEVSDGGLASGYPVYGRTLSLSDEQKGLILTENKALCAKPTSNTGGVYDKMDKDGNLFLSDGTPVNTGGNKGRLYKHTAAAGMYLGDVADSEPALIKRITFSKRVNGYNVTGLYAPAGEVIKLEMSHEDLVATGGITVHIGQALYNGQSNNIWAAKNFNRMPVILNTMVFNAANSTYDEATGIHTCYVGSYLGGPIYIRNNSATFTVTISGGVNYRHFILGKTTEAEYAELSKSTAPIFDLEVWDNGVLHSGPVSYVKNMSYEDIYKAAVLWDKISSLSTQVSKQGIVFLYDPFVAAGAAVAFPGRSSVNCPAGWMTGSLNYEAFVTSGSWGNIHEYNHNFQGWGLPGGGEVTNNALNVAAYSQFTHISSLRRLTQSGDSGLSGWNAYTSAPWALNRVLSGSYGGTDQLCIYATLLHNIGAEKFVLSAHGNGTTAYYNSLCNVTGYDMTYFFRELIAQDPGDSAVAAVKQKSLPVFVPVSSIYQTGRGIIASDGGKQYVKTMQPYKIEYGKPIDITLSRYTVENGQYKSGSVVLPEGFTYSVKAVRGPQNGTFTHKGDNVYVYTPSEALKSGEIIVTLAITKTDGAFEVEDVDLVLEFEQTHEFNRTVLDRTIYTFNDNDAYPSARAAYEANYAGYVSKTERDNKNRVQNSNTDIWEPDPAANAFMEVSGKLFVAADGDYRIALRGRRSAALYVSTDGEDYKYAAGFDRSPDDNYIFRDIPEHYYDMTGLTAGTWVYFKEVLKVDYKSAFIGLGWGMFEVAGTMNENGEFVDENGAVIDEASARKVKIDYANGYRSTYEFPEEEFSSQYLFKKINTYSYDNSIEHNELGKLVSVSGYTPWQDTDEFSINNLFDDNQTNFIHSAKSDTGSDKGRYDITPSNPFDITVDMGVVLTATAMTIYGDDPNKNNRPNYLPKDFELYLGMTQDDLHRVEVSAARSGGKNENVVATFEETRFRYYRLVCTSTYLENNPVGSKYICLRMIKFGYPFRVSNGTLLAVESASSLSGEWSVKYEKSLFGRVYYAMPNAEIELSFTGTYFGILTQGKNQNGCFDVYIDGKLAESGPTGSGDNGTLAYLSSKLEAGEHIVKIVLKDKADIASFIVW